MGDGLPPAVSVITPNRVRIRGRHRSLVRRHHGDAFSTADGMERETHERKISSGRRGSVDRLASDGGELGQ
jgi:hypothetical protein